MEKKMAHKQRKGELANLKRSMEALKNSNIVAIAPDGHFVTKQEFEDIKSEDPNKRWEKCEKQI